MNLIDRSVVHIKIAQSILREAVQHGGSEYSGIVDALVFLEREIERVQKLGQKTGDRS